MIYQTFTPLRPLITNPQIERSRIKRGLLCETADSQSHHKYKLIRVLWIKPIETAFMDEKEKVIFYDVSKDRRKLEEWHMHYFTEEFQIAKEKNDRRRKSVVLVP